MANTLLIARTGGLASSEAHYQAVTPGFFYFPMDKTCPICNHTFYVKPSHAVKRACCSVNCSKERRKGVQKGSNNPNYKGRFLEKIECVICESPFARTSYKTKKTCSDSCYLKLLSKNNVGKIITPQHRAKQSKTIRETLAAKGIFNRETCDCGKSKDAKAVYCMDCFKIVQAAKTVNCIVCSTPFKYRNKNLTTCSKKCAVERRKIIYSGDMNPNWKGGITPKNKLARNSPEFQQWRRDVYRRDNYTCVECGANRCYIHAHHVLPFSTHPELRTDVSNGKTLCVPCHRKYHPSLNIKNYKPQSL